MSRHYRPHLRDADPKPFIQGWHSAAQHGRLALAWLLLQFKAGLEWCLRTGARPNSATILNDPKVWPTIPTLEEIGRGFRPSGSRTPGDDPFPGPSDRYRAQLEDQLARIQRRSAP